MPAKNIEQLCKRCNVFEAALTVRTEPLCRECFSRYVQTKIVKRMEAFRTRHVLAGQERKLLLAMSMGVSSVSLLHILDRHLQTQIQKTGRIGFSLHVVYLTMPTDSSDLRDKFAALTSKYGIHSYTIRNLADLFNDSEALREILEQLPSASAAADVIAILRTRLITQIAQEYGCEGILWGDSTTQLAGKVLAETAKGRGFSLPWQVADGPSPHGLPFYYPVRDVLKKELISHATLVDRDLLEFVDDQAFTDTQAPPSAKNTTIDVLMKQYFEDVEESYPSIVSNVVRTTGKLEAPGTVDGKVPCKLCLLPVDSSQLGIDGWGGYQEAEVESPTSNTGLCYGCSRSYPPELLPLLP